MTQALNRNTKSSNGKKTVKFLYSYNGQILPRRSDGLLRYVGGYTRVLSVDLSITLAELLVKFGELCGQSMDLKCKLPNEDLDVLISIKSDEELRNLMNEYDRVSELTKQEMKIRAVLFPVQPFKRISPPPSPMFTTGSLTPPTTASSGQPARISVKSFWQSPPASAVYAAGARDESAGGRCCPHGSPLRQQYFVLHSNCSR